MSWLEQSIMRQRGVAQGRQAVTHELTEAKQGNYHYTIGPYSQPVLSVKPGDRIIVETRDAFEGKVKTEQDLPSKVLTMPFVNPQNGPIMVEGAQPGDVIAVYIESIAPRGPNPRGTCAMIPEFGALSATMFTSLLTQPLPEIVRKIDVDEKGVYWSKRVTLPYKPHIGTLSCSPMLDSINTLTPDTHGGNMDLPDMGPGSITYLPVCTDGARVFIGDAHACQGDGEVCGTAVEFQSTTLGDHGAGTAWIGATRCYRFDVHRDHVTRLCTLDHDGAVLRIDKRHGQHFGGQVLLGFDLAFKCIPRLDDDAVARLNTQHRL